MVEVSELQALSERLEHFHTPEWAARKILEHELLTRLVFDPCSGSGVLWRAAEAAGYETRNFDIHQWGEVQHVTDFLNLRRGGDLGEFSVFMNPPFSKAEAFIEKCFELGARKIVCFQRFSWWESADRKEFWDKYPPNRIYVCGNRADCWRHDLAILPPEKRINPKTGKKMAGTPTAHAFFVFEPSNPVGTVMGRIYK